MCGWALLTMNYDVGTLGHKYCIVFGILIGLMLQEMTVDSKVGKTDCTALRQLLHTTADHYRHTNRCGERVGHGLEVVSCTNDYDTRDCSRSVWQTINSKRICVASDLICLLCNIENYNQ